MSVAVGVGHCRRLLHDAYNDMTSPTGKLFCVTSPWPRTWHGFGVRPRVAAPVFVCVCVRESGAS